jgi:hypothetical protein
MEHAWSPFFTFARTEYLKVFSDAVMTWCFTEVHKQHMVEAHNFLADDIAVVPLFTKGINLPQGMTPEQLRERARLHEVAQALQPVDLSFSGSTSTRRSAMLLAILANATRDGLACEFDCLQWFDMLHGERRHLQLLNAKVLLNIHHSDGSSLEVHRINHLLSLSKCVVSERSEHDADLDAVYEGGVVFADNATHMYDLARYYATNDVARAEVEAAAYRKFLQVNTDYSSLRRSMEKIVLRITGNS